MNFNADNSMHVITKRVILLHHPITLEVSRNGSISRLIDVLQWYCSYLADVFCCVGCGLSYSSPLCMEKHTKYCSARSHLYGQTSAHRISVHLAKRTNTGDHSYGHDNCEPNCSVGHRQFKQYRKTEEKRYACNDCGYKSNYRSALVEHSGILRPKTKRMQRKR